MNCGQCVYFVPSGYENWGKCRASFPAWINGEKNHNIVWIIEGHPNNYADECEMFGHVKEDYGHINTRRVFETNG